MGFLPLGSLPLGQVQSPRGRQPDGQMRCPVSLEAKGGVRSPTKDCPSGACQQARRSQPFSNPCWSFPGSFPRFLPLLTSWLLGPLRKLRNFSNPERKQICIGWMTVSALRLPIPWARGHWALHGRTYLRTQRIFLYIFHKRQVH